MIKLPEASFQESWRRSIDCFDSERYDAFIRALDRFADAPPWLSSAAGRADRVLLPLLREEWTRFRKKGGKAFARDADPLQLDRLRAAGDAAGRAHWVCVALEPTFGRKVKQMGKAAERVQVLVDQERDAALTQHLLTDAGEQQQLSDGEVGFALERLRALETRSGVEASPGSSSNSSAKPTASPFAGGCASEPGRRGDGCYCGSSVRSHKVVPWRSRRDTVMAPSVAMATWPKNWLPPRGDWFG